MSTSSLNDPWAGHRVTKPVSVAMTESKFVVKEKFVINKDDDALVKICHVGDNFSRFFLNKIEEIKDGHQTLSSCFPPDSADDVVIKSFGGEDASEVTLFEVFSLMEKQGKGERNGILMVNSYANVFYVKDVEGILRAVYLFWEDEGWCILAFVTNFMTRHFEGRRILCRIKT